MGLRAMLGMGESFNWPCALRVTSGILPPSERSLGNGIFNSGAAIGAVLTPLIVPYLAHRLGWRYAFVILGLGGPDLGGRVAGADSRRGAGGRHPRSRPCARFRRSPGKRPRDSPWSWPCRWSRRSPAGSCCPSTGGRRNLVGRRPVHDRPADRGPGHAAGMARGGRLGQEPGRGRAAAPVLGDGGGGRHNQRDLALPGELDGALLPGRVPAWPAGRGAWSAPSPSWPRMPATWGEAC